MASVCFFNLQAYGMEKENYGCLDQEWTWRGAPRLMDVINMPFKRNKSPEKIHVAVVDDYVNPDVCTLSEDSDIYPFNLKIPYLSSESCR